MVPLSLPKQLNQLTRLETLLSSLPSDSLSYGGGELFLTNERIFGLDDRSIMVFRYADLRKIGSLKIASNVPTDVSLGAFFDPFGISRDDPRYVSIRRMTENAFFTASPEKHQLLKPVFSRPLMPDQMHPFAVATRTLATEMFVECAGKGEIEFCGDFAIPLMFRLWGDILGMTADEISQLRALMAGMAPVVMPGVKIDIDALDRLNSTVVPYMEFLGQVLARAKESKKAAFMVQMADLYAAISPGRADMPESCEAMAAFSMIDGFDALGAALTSCVYALVSFPGVLSAIRSDPALIDAAVAEAIRLFAPVRMLARAADGNFEFDGLIIPQGTVIVMNWGAGARDPAAFDQPLEFRLDRPARPLPSFGAGRQVCPGQNLVRTFCRSTLEALVETGMQVERAGYPQWDIAKPLSFNAKLSTLPVTLSA